MNDENNPGPNPWIRSLMIWAGVLLALAIIVSAFEGRGTATKQEAIPYSEFLKKVDEGSVKEITESGDVINGTTTNGDKFKTYAVNDPGLTERLAKKNVSFGAKPEEGPSLWRRLFHHAPDAKRRWQWRDGLWQIARQIADRKAGPCHV
jgi:cell division protease FtsH